MIDRELIVKQGCARLAKQDFCGGIVVSCSHKSPAKDTVNEDAAAIVQMSQGHGLLIVTDGVGGHQAGDRAARVAVETIVGSCRSAASETSLRAQILDGIEAANEEVLSWGIGAASTVVVAEFLNGKVRVIHVGDSTALLTSNRGTVKFLSVAHAPIAMAVEIGMMNESEAIAHEDRNLITNCIGFKEMKIEIGPIVSMAARDTLVLASDGLWDNLTSTEVVDSIRASCLLKQTNVMVELTKDRMADESGAGKPDDLTVLCFRQCHP